MITIRKEVVKEVIGTKNTKKILETIHTGLQVLAGQTEKLMRTIENLESEDKQSAGKTDKGKAKAGSSKKTRSKPVAKKKAQASPKRPTPTKKNATDTVVEAVEKARKPVDVATLAKTTGFEQKKVRNIVSRATKQGRINRAGRGLYKASSAK